MKIIFLDIDGVLNNAMDECKHKLEVEIDDEAKYYPHSHCNVRILNRLIELTSAKIVVSSTWRLGLDLPEMKKVLDAIGVVGDCIGMTDNINDAYALRGNEILKWIKDNEKLVGEYYQYNTYVILDDDSDMLYWQKDNFVHVDPTIGLTDRNIGNAIKILNQKAAHITDHMD